MINLHDLKAGEPKKRRKKVGRGLGSGHGTYSGRGAKGQKARSGGSIRPGFEGGRMPLIRQVPKMRGKGFTGSRIETSEVNLSDLATHFADGEVITNEILVERGLARTLKVKILGTGNIDGRKLKIQNVAITKSAKKSVEEVGGEVVFDEENNISEEIASSNVS